ncbi:MAG: DUF3800 domain-containing protein [Actinomycetia bacterium]|nr:DUF3800 domain-containing protein [Actinomycetes bacterium]
MSNLFGYQGKKEEFANLKLFCDESGTDDWLYLGILIIPKVLEQELLQDLLNSRCGNPKGNKLWGKCNPLCKFHRKNDTEVHFSEIKKSKDKYFVAQRWLDYFLNDRKNIYFYILGINLTKLDKSKFGIKRQQNNIYNRFFRTAILKSVKSYFYKYNKIIIENIYHDNSISLQTHSYFSWHSIFYISDKDEKIYFRTNEIDFIDSDHRKSSNSYSNFIQFIDLILGCARNCIEYTSKNIDKEELSIQCLPIISRLIKNPNNINSKYNYVGRQKIEFFPKHDLKNIDENTLVYKYKKMVAFFTKKNLRIENRKQGSLF